VLATLPRLLRLQEGEDAREEGQQDGELEDQCLVERLGHPTAPHLCLQAAEGYCDRESELEQELVDPLLEGAGLVQDLDHGHVVTHDLGDVLLVGVGVLGGREQHAHLLVQEVLELECLHLGHDQ